MRRNTHTLVHAVQSGKSRRVALLSFCCVIEGQEKWCLLGRACQCHGISQEDSGKDVSGDEDHLAQHNAIPA